MRARKRAIPYRPHTHLNAEYAPEELEAVSAYSRRIAANIHAASLKEAKERKGSDES